MRNATKKSKIGLSALAAAGLAAWAGAPAAHGSVIVSIYNEGSGTAVGTTQSYTTYVFAVQTTTAGLNDGTSIEAIQTILDTAPANAGAFAVDDETNGSTGSKARYTANIDGEDLPTNAIDEAQNNTGVSIYGDPEGGTFGGIGYNYNSNSGNPGVGAAFVPGDISDNPFITYGAGNDAKVFTNQQTQTYTSTGNLTANYAGSTLANFDAAFKVGSAVANPGQINNGSLYSLELDMADESNSIGTATPQPTVAGGTPFEQVVVKTGTTFTLNAQFSGSGPDGIVNYSTVISGNISSPKTFTSIGIVNSSPAGTAINSPVYTISGSNGKYQLHNFSVTGSAQSAGYTDVNGFSPANDAEIYGLAVDSNGTLATGSTLATIVSDINSDLTPENASWAAYALPVSSPSLPASASSLLVAQGDNVEVVFPAGSVTDDAYFQFATSTGITVTQVSVVPEPTGIGAMVLGGLGLLNRRRRSRKA